VAASIRASGGPRGAQQSTRAQQFGSISERGKRPSIFFACAGSGLTYDHLGG
jgi:hypothetical protein